MTPPDRTLLYHIQVNGQLDERWLSWFDGLSLSQTSGSNLTIIHAILDQSGLHGVLNRIFDLGFELLSVQAFPIPSEPDFERKES